MSAEIYYFSGTGLASRVRQLPGLLQLVPEKGHPVRIRAGGIPVPASGSVRVGLRDPRPLSGPRPQGDRMLKSSMQTVSELTVPMHRLTSVKSL